jgi:hypothetical protein
MIVEICAWTTLFKPEEYQKVERIKEKNCFYHRFLGLVKKFLVLCPTFRSILNFFLDKRRNSLKERINSDEFPKMSP